VITCVGKQIQKALARKTGLTPTRLAKLAGIDPRRFGLILRDETRPSMAEVERLARVLCVKVSFLLTEEGEPRPVKSNPNLELMKLLEDSRLALNFRLLGELDDKEQRALIKVIEGLTERKKMAAKQVVRG
jgi:transcriptional regulator with XRE-family HTH domain